MDGSILAAVGVLLAVTSVAGLQSQRRRSRRRRGEAPARAGVLVGAGILVTAVLGLLLVGLAVAALVNS
jgi:tetrahydromethanopterin S-methyltransferase subunit B